jgi:hypothetical protein
MTTESCGVGGTTDYTDDHGSGPMNSHKEAQQAQKKKAVFCASLGLFAANEIV